MTTGKPIPGVTPTGTPYRAGEPTRCAGCGQAPANPMARAEVAMTWLLPGPTGSPSVEVAHFCRGCVPAGPVDEVICVRCGDGPLLGGALAAGTEEASAVVHDWLGGAGWRLSGPVCPGCVREVAR